MKNFTMHLVVGVAALGGCTASAQTATIREHHTLGIASTANMERIPPASGLSAHDWTFVKDCAKGHMAEIMMGRIAQANGSGWSKEFGMDMVREHGLALEELKTIAQQKGFALPSGVNMSQMKMINKLSRTSAGAFDATYQKMMLMDHGVDLHKVQAEIHNGRDAMVRGYAVKLETAIKLHHDMASTRTTMENPHE